MTEWFEEWFGEEYLRLYPHRDDAEAAQAIALVDRHVPLAGLLALDLACGPGRHAVQLAERGARVVGFDLSMPMLARARQRTQSRASLVRGDIRFLPFARERFDIVLNLFTSFGYFADDELHRAVVREVRALLRPGGTFVLDYFNSRFVRRSLVPREVQQAGSQRVVVERNVSPDDRFVVKRIHLEDDGRSFTERVRLFTPTELERLLDDGGLVVHARFGGYDGAPVAPASPRVILMARPV